jgi:hypothetical protein
MRPRKYPLEPLAELRARRVDEAVGDLAAATRERDAAERRRLAAEREREAHDVGVERVRSAEAEALAQGGLRAADMAQAAAWEARVGAERDALASGVERARGEEAGARAGEGRAIDEVASRRAEARVVANDQARWDGVERKRAEAREEEASSEAWRPAKP